MMTYQLRTAHPSQPLDDSGVRVQQQIAALNALGVRKALTLWPEWAWAICYLDKLVENRGWAPPESLIGQRIAIHAGAHIGGRKGKFARAEGVEAVLTTAVHAGWEISEQFVRGHDIFVEMRKGAPLVEFNPGKITTGAIVAHARLAQVREGDPDEHSGWYFGPCGWRIEDVVVLAEPIPMSGAQGLWELAG